VKSPRVNEVETVEVLVPFGADGEIISVAQNEDGTHVLCISQMYLSDTKNGGSVTY
jgi:hypothetical protein